MFVMHEDAFQSAGGSNRPIRALDLTNPNGYVTIGGTGAGYAMMMAVDPNNADRLFFGNDWTISTASGCVPSSCHVQSLSPSCVWSLAPSRR